MALRRLFPLLIVACSGDVAVEHVSTVTFVSETFECDCMPAYPPDPLGTITMDYVAGDAPVEFKTVAIYRFTKNDGTPGATVTRMLTPAGSGLLTSGEHLSVVHVTTDTPGSLEAVCTSVWPMTYVLEVDVTGPAGTQTFTQPSRSFSCSD